MPIVGHSPISPSPRTEIRFDIPASGAANGPSSTYLIFFIPGNPGLIEYYHEYLERLYISLSSFTSPMENVSFELYGRSLRGFECGEESVKPDKMDDKTLELPLGLQDQISFVERTLSHTFHRLQHNSTKGASNVNVILIGHSLGTYISLEIIRRVREEMETASLRIAGAICLFPTVVDLAASPKGKKLKHFLHLQSLPILIPILCHLIKVIIILIPLRVLTLLIRLVLGFANDAARTTSSFLKSKNGVHQALYMAVDELRQMNHDAWDSEIWGATHPSPHPHPRPKLFFYYGQKDDWIADETRDALIKLRGRNHRNGNDDDWRPIMVIDKNRIPHDFCVNKHYSLLIAEKSAEWVVEIVDTIESAKGP
ncbi:hypothetical protein M501DRAFT_969798 [Patellaria atrata CBS 101060]|uniref:Lipid droplet-associated hydrolase n=1 Tax=Patellaria atrata CBS 101060 TaxID=1346257 RepID=A0A9P4SGY4_9PEZI|nr:hypothetical protein M501DRAFT_969798 [Patellaria atrata CBS 101060]